MNVNKTCRVANISHIHQWSLAGVTFVEVEVMIDPVLVILTIKITCYIRA